MYAWLFIFIVDFLLLLCDKPTLVRKDIFDLLLNSGMESAESNLAEQHLREYSLSQHKLDGDVSTSMVELGLNDAGNLPSRKLKLFVSCEQYVRYLSMFFKLLIICPMQPGIWGMSLQWV